MKEGCYICYKTPFADQTLPNLPHANMFRMLQQEVNFDEYFLHFHSTPGHQQFQLASLFASGGFSGAQKCDVARLNHREERH